MIRLPMNFKKKIALLVLSAATLQTATAGVATSVMQTAPVKAPGEYEIKLQTDVIFNSGGGVNISPHFVTGLIEHFFDIDAYFGTGKTGFMVGATTKYNLLPDLPNQMGLSFLAGLALLKDKVAFVDNGASVEEDLTRGLLSFGVLASKEVATDFGTVSPYAVFQPEFLIHSKDSYFLMNLALGAHWKVSNTSPWSFYSEFGISLRRSHYMLALGVAHPF